MGMTEEQATAVVDQQPSAEPPAPEDDGPPSGEQAAPQQGRPPTSKPQTPLDARALLAGLNRQSQTNAAMKKALGLSAGTPDTEVLAKIEGLMRPKTSEAPDLDPEYAARESEIIEREWRTAERVAGPEQVALARQIQELAFTDNPLDFVDAVGELVKQYVDRTAPAEPPPSPSNGAKPPAATAPASRAPDDIAPEGDGPVGWQARPEQEEVGSGDVEGAVARMLARLSRNR